MRQLYPPVRDYEFAYRSHSLLECVHYTVCIQNLPSDDYTSDLYDKKVLGWGKYECVWRPELGIDYQFDLRSLDKKDLTLLNSKAII